MSWNSFKEDRHDSAEEREGRPRSGEWCHGRRSEYSPDDKS
jgi:hypothetical protein